MRAVVYLFLLKAAFTAAQFHWDGPAHVTHTPRPRTTQQVTQPVTENTDNACLADQASCGCCLMQKKLHRMETFFNLTLREMDENLSSIKNMINNLRASRTAASVSLNNRPMYMGPMDEEKVIVYKHIFINLGNNYDVNTGVYTAPRSGVYNIALSVYADAGFPGGNLAACVRLRVNKVGISGPSEKYSDDQEDSSSIVLVQQLKAGDKVDVVLPVGCFLTDNADHYNTFSIFLLYTTD